MKTALLIVFTIVFIQSMSGLPRYALLVGTRCASCHVNPTGGQMRNDYGLSYSVNAIPLRSTDVAPAQSDSSGDSTDNSAAHSGFTFDPHLTDNITIGGDYRGQFIYDIASKTTTFQGMTATIYTTIQIAKTVTLYYKQDILNQAYSNPASSNFAGPEIFSIIEPMSGFYLKGGAFLPDYGWRVDDHTQYTRGGDLGYITSLGLNGGLIFTPNYKDIGAEIGWWTGGLMMTAGLFNGTGNSTPIDFSNQKAFAAKIEYLGTMTGLNYRIGASGYGFKEFHMGGFHAGLGAGNIVVFGEIDWTRNQLDGSIVVPDTRTMASFVEADYRVIKGAWGIVRYETFDPAQGIPDDPNYVKSTVYVIGENAVHRLVVGAEVFPCSFVEIRPQYRFNIESPSIDNNVALVQVHYWF
jgi:hypothetical protein